SFIHHMKAHEETPPYQCPQCEYSCSTFSCLLTHMYWHAGYNLYQCRFCTFFSLYFAGMVRHSCIHTRAEPYSCEFCQSAFTSTLELHLKIHTNEKPFVCKDCNKTFKTSNHLQKHSLLHMKNGQHQPSFYQCAECEYTTCILSNLEIHIRTHTGEKPYSCTVCQMKFRTSSHLRRHRVTHFNTEHFKEGSSSLGCLYEHKEHKMLPVKTYKCEECGYCTAHNSNLKLHLRTHTGEKPFKCGQCAMAFRTSSHLKRHLLTH
ncbi:ZN431 protein, partial [Furnarius figulus]|nr:ZN431 protein [Furnarius figulus]